MKSIVCNSLLPLAMLLLSACSATGPKFTEAAQPAANETLIYMYRPEKDFFFAIQSHFYIDGKKVVSLNNGGYSAFYLAPGTHTFKQHWTGMDSAKETVEFPITVAAGESHHYRLTIALDSFMILPAYRGASFVASHKWVVEDVEQSEAIEQMGYTRYQSPYDVPGVRKIGPEKI
jgi:hypothetical protein